MTGRSDAWFPFYSSDYLRDTMHLTTEQHGAYLLLIMGSWNRGGPLPSDDKQLAAIARLSLSSWRRMRPVIAPFFRQDGDAWVSPRLEREIARSKAISEARQQAGRKGGRPSQTESKKKAIGLANENQTGLQTETHARVALPLPSEDTDSVPNGTGDAAPIDPEKKAWDDAIALLTTAGRMKSGAARGFIGKLKSDHGISAKDLLPAIGQAIANGTQDPAAYLRKAAAGIESRRSGGGMASAPHDEQTDTLEQWRWRLDQLAGPNRIWIESMYGPPPGRPGCRVPRELLEPGREAQGARP